MKTKVISLIMLCLFINLFSSFTVNAEEKDALTGAALDNTMNVARGFFISYCSSMALKVVMENLNFEKQVSGQARQDSKKKSGSKKDCDKAFLVKTMNEYSRVFSACKLFSGSAGTFVFKDTSIQFNVLLNRFLMQRFIFLLFMALFYLLPRGAIDNYALINIINSRR